MTWQDLNNCYYAYNYKNPAIASYEVTIYNADGTVFLNVPNWTYHSQYFFLYNDPKRLEANNQQGGNFYCAFQIPVGSYSAGLKVHGTDGSVLETEHLPFTVAAVAAALVAAPTVTMKTVKKK